MDRVQHAGTVEYGGDEEAGVDMAETVQAVHSRGVQMVTVCDLLHTMT